MGVFTKHLSCVCMKGKGGDFNVPNYDDEINSFSTVTHENVKHIVKLWQSEDFFK